MRLSDRKQIRRAYLRRILGQAVSESLTAIGGFSIMLATPFYLAYKLYVHVSSPFGKMLILTLFAEAVGAWIWFAIQLAKDEYAKAIADAEFVPPVTPSTLPDEEVLVRGTEEPSAPSETLLRATVKGEETKPEELLRVAAGATGERN